MILPEEILAYLGVLEEHQRELQKISPGGFRDPGLKRYTEFHSLLVNPSIRPEDVIENLNAHSEGANTIPLSMDMAIEACSMARSGFVFLPDWEPPHTSIALLFALSKIRANTDRAHKGFSLLICTDTQYRPHGHVRKLSDSTYSIVLGRTLVFDLFSFSACIYEPVAAIKNLMDVDFVGAFRTGNMLAAMDQSHHGRQFPFVIAGMFLGERLRPGILVDPDALMRSGRNIFANCMLVYLVGHEIGHIMGSHFSECRNGEASLFSEFWNAYVENSSNPFYAKNRAATDWYRSNYGESHGHEIEADFYGLQLAMDVSVDLCSNKYLGMAAAFMTLKIISTLDKIQFFQSSRRSIFEIVSLDDFNGVPCAPDIRVPLGTHPWGKTRLQITQVMYFYLYAAQHRDSKDKVDEEARSLKHVFTTSCDLIDRYEQRVFHIYNEVLARGGEITANILQDEIHVLQYRPGTETRVFSCRHGSDLRGPWCDHGNLSEN